MVNALRLMLAAGGADGVPVGSAQMVFRRPPLARPRGDARNLKSGTRREKGLHPWVDLRRLRL